MSRRQQLRRLQAAETALAESRQVLQGSAQARLDELRRMPTVWLVTGGFVAGVIVHRGAACLGHSRLASSVLVTALRVSRLAAGSLLSGVSRIDP